LKVILLGILLAGIFIYIDRSRSKKGHLMKGSWFKTGWTKFKDVITDKTYPIIFGRIVLLFVVILLLATYLRIYFHKREIVYVHTAPGQVVQTQQSAYISSKPSTHYKGGVRYHISVPSDHTIVKWCLQNENDAEVTWYRYNSNTIAMRNLLVRDVKHGTTDVRKLYDGGGGWPGEYEVVFDRNVTVVETIIVP
jgi:hypothetical protein